MVGSLLLRKAVRDLRQSAVSFVAIGLMVALGVAFLIGAYSVYVNLDRSYQGSYRQLDFEDFSIRFHAAPARVLSRLHTIPGLAGAEGRWVEDTALELDDRPGAKMVGRLIGIPVDRELRTNQLKLVKGRPLGPNDDRAVLVEANFAQHHMLGPGDAVTIERNGVRVPFSIVGVVQSCEYLYVVRSKQELISMPDTFGVMFLSESSLGRLFGRLGEINEIHARVVDPTERSSVMLAARQALAAYDPEIPVAREDQPSYQMLQQDVQGFQAYAVLFPLLFLGVAVASVSTMLTRQVHTQRTVIGLLRSLGFSKAAVLRHFLTGTVIVGVLASTAGAFLGLWLADVLSRFYMSQLQVPFPEIVPRWNVTVFGVAIGVATCALAALSPSRQAAGIPPAEAMRPVAPSYGSRSLRIDRWLPKTSLLTKIPLRNVFRQPRRTFSTLVGVVSALCLMVMARGLLDSMGGALDKMLDGMFGYDIRVDFVEFQSRRTAETMRSWPGVVWAEGTLELPMEFRKGGRSYSALLNGVEPGSRLRPLVDAKGNPLVVSEDGGIFGPALRSRLNLSIGDTVWVSLPEQMTAEASRAVPVRVVGFNQEAIGTQVYMLRSEVERRFRRELGLPGNAITGVAMKVDRPYLADVRRRALDLPHAGSAMMQVSIRAMVQRLVETSRRFVLIMEVFGFILAFATLFNTITINVLERRAEMATLRTLGVSGGQIGRMVATESMVVAGLGVLVGLPIANAFVHLFWQAAQTPEQQELFSFDVQIMPTTFLTASIAVFVICAVALVPALRVVQRMDLAKAVKERST